MAGHDHIRQPARFINIEGIQVGFFRQAAVELDAALEHLQRGAHGGVHFSIHFRTFVNRAGAYNQERLFLNKIEHFHPAAGLHQGRARAIRHIEQAAYRHFYPNRVEISGAWFVDFRITLGEGNHRLIVKLRLLDRQQCAFLVDKNWRDHMGKYHQVSQRQHRALDQTIFVGLSIGDIVQLLGPPVQRFAEVIVFIS
jgi:hypothetical protein